MTWTKRGRIFEPAGQASWIGSHAALPVVQRLDASPGSPRDSSSVARERSRDRVYFSSRDARGRSHIGFIELSLDAPDDLLDVSPAAVLSPGELGTFDDAGVTSSCLVEHGGRLYAYYTGWSLGVSVPFYLAAGLAVSDDGGRTFQRVSTGPLLDRNDVDPYLTASPWVIVEDGTWRMWYVSGTEWTPTPAGPRHRYHIRYAESRDGLVWNRRGLVCIDYASADEYAFGRPCVIRDGDRYRMWYSYRGERYRIGYAESEDGLRWARMDATPTHVIDVSDSGWDAEMVTYPVVVRDRADGARWHMLYNGNDYGRSGIGYATFL